jgi:hypothetical protein
MTINFGLEAHILILPKTDFFTILQGNGPGPNPDKAKAKRLRSFTIPNYTIEEGSSTKINRKINILAAVVMETQVIALVDFARLARIHIRSRNKIYHPHNLSVESEVYSFHWQQVNINHSLISMLSFGQGSGPNFQMDRTGLLNPQLLSLPLNSGVILFETVILDGRSP